MAILTGGRTPEEDAFRRTASSALWDAYSSTPAGQIAGSYRGSFIAIEPTLRAFSKLLKHFSSAPTTLHVSTVMQPSHAEVFLQFRSAAEKSLVRLAVPLSFQEFEPGEAVFPLSSGSSLLAFKEDKIRLRVTFLRPEIIQHCLQTSFQAEAVKSSIGGRMYRLSKTLFYHLSLRYEI